ncbi:MAG: hypothetical protein AAGG00_19910 [Cyanobacteria bacterium P01_H01_bin.150]
MVRVISTKPIWHSPESKTRRKQTSEETLQAQEQLLIQILEEREKELREEQQKEKPNFRNPKNEFKNKNKKKSKQPASTKQPQKTAPLKPTMAKIEVTVKFSELPEAEPAENKKVKLYFVDDNSNKYSSLINKKSWNKAVKRIEEISANEGDWIGAVAGVLVVEEGQFTVANAGIQVFEKKKKEVKEESSE